MAQRPFDQLGKLQRAIVEAVWELGEATVRQVRIRIDPQKKLAYTTFLSSMQKLEQSGWLQHYSKGRAYVYKPTQSRRSARVVSLRGFARRAFNGNQLLLFQTLIETMRLADEDIAELEKMVDEHRKGQADD